MGCWCDKHPVITCDGGYSWLFSSSGWTVYSQGCGRDSHLPPRLFPVVIHEKCCLGSDVDCGGWGTRTRNQFHPLATHEPVCSRRYSIRCRSGAEWRLHIFNTQPRCGRQHRTLDYRCRLANWHMDCRNASSVSSKASRRTAAELSLLGFAPVLHGVARRRFSHCAKILA